MSPKPRKKPVHKCRHHGSHNLGYFAVVVAAIVVLKIYNCTKFDTDEMKFIAEVVGPLVGVELFRWRREKSVQADADGDGIPDSEDETPEGDS